MGSGNKLSPTGAAITISPFCVTNGGAGGCNSNIYALGIDGAGNAWGGENLFLYSTFYYGFVELNNSGSAILSVDNRQLPRLIAIDTSGNVCSVPAQVSGQFPAPISITVELVGASTPVIIPSVGVQNHTVGMRP